MILLWLITAVVGLVVTIGALLLVLLAVPVGVRVTKTVDSERIMVKAHWLWGVVSIPLTGRHRKTNDTKTRDTRKRRKRRATDEHTKRHHDASHRSRRPAPEEIPVIVRTVTILLRRIVRRFKVAAEGELRIGLSDPADTGILWGVSAPFLVPFTERVGLRVQPSFVGAECSFTGQAAVEVVPATVVVPVLRFGLSRDGRTMVRILRGRA
jgi:hypothetical protein